MRKNILIILGFTLIYTQVAVAANNNLFTSYPSFTKDHNKWIVRDANPGQITEDFITLENLSDQTMTLNLDVKELEGTQEKPKIIENKQYQNIGNWTKTEDKQVTLSAHQKSKVKITLRIPANATPGAYQEVILVSHTSKQKTNLDVATRIGNRIYLNITTQKELQTNTQNFNITTLQIALIILASLGILISLLIPAKQKQL